MKKTDPNSVAKRIREIAAEISSITEFAEGSIASSRKQYVLKDGTVKRASPQFRFQTKGGRDKQVCKYVPPCAVARVKELIENGRRYRRLETEYSRLITAQSLSSLKIAPGRHVASSASFYCSGNEIS